MTLDLEKNDLSLTPFRPSRWTLLIGPHAMAPLILNSLIRLISSNPAGDGSLTVLDCGRQFNATIIARAAHGRAELADRIRIQRAFMCDEVANLIRRTPLGRAPVLVLDLLNTFCDENVQIGRRRFLLEGCLRNLERLSAGPGLAVSVHPPREGSDAIPLFERLRSAAPEVLTYETPAASAQQLRLF
ncbi:MAG: hypothetical protein A2Y54_04910 [Chloroflexi bacterium RBG_16_51_16]|nr:MAG: hypothetical protein A2Y54_04910 [Chloroflexi bacterium RBG_16_51_16]